MGMARAPVEVRAATPADVEVIAAFNRAMALETECRTLDSQVTVAGVRRGIEDPERCRYFVADSEGAVVGQTMITAEWSDWRDGFFWWIQSVYVAPRHRGKGVFRALYEHIRTLARQRSDVCGIRLYVHRGNRRALETYRKLGMALTDYVLCEQEW